MASMSDTPITLSAAAAAELVQRCAAAHGCGPGELPGRLAGLVDAPPAVWAARYRGQQQAATWASAVLAMGSIGRLALPRLAADYHGTAPWRSLQHRLHEVHGPQALTLEPVLRRCFALVPRLEDIDAAIDAILVAYQGRPPSSLISVLAGLRPSSWLVVGEDSPWGAAGRIDAAAAARMVRGPDGQVLALELLRADTVPPVVAGYARHAGRRLRSGAYSPVPVRTLAGMPAEAAALWIHGAPRQLPGWASGRAVAAHCHRLARVLGLCGVPTLDPDLSLLVHIRVDDELAVAYDLALEHDASERAEELVESDGCGAQEAARRARQQVMAGFRPFLEHLMAVADLGARLDALPHGIAAAAESSGYDPIREDLAPTPETYLQWLALLPQLSAGEPDAAHVIIQSVTACRAFVTLGLQRDCWIDCDEGALLFARPASNKTGRQLLLLASAWIDRYGISASWLPEAADAAIAGYRRDELADCFARMRQRFAEATGTDMVGRPVAFTRSGMAQVLRRQLVGLDREAITAQLGHRRRITRANYWRPRLDEVLAAYSRRRRPHRDVEADGDG